MPKALLHELHGKSLTLKEWGRIYNINPKTVQNRLQRGWSLLKALNTPTTRGARITVFDETRTTRQWAKAAGVTLSTINRRKREGLRGADLVAPKPRGEEITAFGKTLTYKEWQEQKGIYPGTLRRRLKVLGMPPDVALNAPVQKYERNPRHHGEVLLQAFGKEQTYTAWAKELGISRQTIYWRLKVRQPPMSLEEALLTPRYGVAGKEKDKCEE